MYHDCRHGSVTVERTPGAGKFSTAIDTCLDCAAPFPQSVSVTGTPHRAPAARSSNTRTGARCTQQQYSHWRTDSGPPMLLPPLTLFLFSSSRGSTHV